MAKVKITEEVFYEIRNYLVGHTREQVCRKFGLSKYPVALVAKFNTYSEYRQFLAQKSAMRAYNRFQRGETAYTRKYAFGQRVRVADEPEPSSFRWVDGNKQVTHKEFRAQYNDKTKTIEVKPYDRKEDYRKRTTKAFETAAKNMGMTLEEYKHYKGQQLAKGRWGKSKVKVTVPVQKPTIDVVNKPVVKKEEPVKVKTVYKYVDKPQPQTQPEPQPTKEKSSVPFVLLAAGITTIFVAIAFAIVYKTIN